MTATDVVRLARGDAACEIAPSLGGAILRLTVAARDLLRRSPPGVADVHDVASFTMLPFANRIDHGVIRKDGRDVAIGIDPEGDPHALHGHGWRSAWTHIGGGPDRAILALAHDAPDWPWPYLAEQHIRLLPDGLAIDIVIRNRHPGDAMPAGVGLHPYFARTPDSRVASDAAIRWRNDDSGLAVAPIDDDRFRSDGTCPVAAMAGLDHYFATDARSVVVDGDVRLSGEAMAGFHAYVPEGADFFCIEPVSHAPNSFGRGEFGIGDLIPPLGERIWRFAIRLDRNGGKAGGSARDRGRP